MTNDEARAQISRLIFLGDLYNDTGQFDKLGQLFADGEIGVEGMGDVVCRGAEETAAQFRSTTMVYDGGSPKIHHQSTNLIIDVDLEAGTAECQSRYTMLQQFDDSGVHTLLAGRNEDSFVLTGDTWVWKRRFIRVDLAGDLSHHLKAAATPFTE